MANHQLMPVPYCPIGAVQAASAGVDAKALYIARGSPARPGVTRVTLVLLLTWLSYLIVGYFCTFAPGSHSRRAARRWRALARCGCSVLDSFLNLKYIRKHGEAVTSKSHISPRCAHHA